MPEQKHLIDDNKPKKKGKGKFIAEISILVIMLLVSLGLIFNKQIRDAALHWSEVQSVQNLKKGAKNGDLTKGDIAKKNRELAKLQEEYRKALADGNTALANKIKKKIDAMQPKGTSYSWKDVKPISTQSALKNTLDKNRAGALGDVAIPKAGLAFPINAGIGSWALSSGFGTFSSLQQMGVGNYPLAAHNLSTTGQLGAKLDYARKGYKVYLTDLNRIYVYKVYYTGKFPPTATWVTDINKTHNGRPVAILLTCNDWGETRRIVFSEYVTQYKATKHNLKVFKNLYQ